MNAQTFILSVILFIMTALPLKESVAALKQDRTLASTELISADQGLDYHYVRVNIDGKWFIYVYDGEQLIDIIPLD